MGVVFTAATTFVLVFTGWCLNFDIFVNVPFTLMYLVFFTMGIVMVMMSFWISTLVSTQAGAYTVSYAFVLLNIVLELVFLNGDLLYMLFYNSDTMDLPIVKLMKCLLYMLPTFPLSIIFATMAKTASTHLDANSMSW